jgi:hypothetical protein
MKVKFIKVKFLKATDEFKAGDTAKVSDATAFSLQECGIAEMLPDETISKPVTAKTVKVKRNKKPEPA